MQWLAWAQHALFPSELPGGLLSPWRSCTVRKPHFLLKANPPGMSRQDVLAHPHGSSCDALSPEVLPEFPPILGCPLSPRLPHIATPDQNVQEEL